MTDIDDAMSETQSKAKSKFGVGDDSDETDETDTNADSSKTSNHSDNSKTSNSTDTTKTEDSPNTSNTSKTSKTGSAATESETETTQNESVNGDRGRLVDERVNINIYVTDDMRDDLDFLYKQMDLEYTETTGEDLAKNWDFYPAVVRTVLQNKDDLRDELGIS